MNLPNRYFSEIKSAWSPYENGVHRIIPFCTPVNESPIAIVIGTNHSDFVIGGGRIAEQIATDFANALPQVNTYLQHDHRFSQGLREICAIANITITNNWIGTNRCALQTGPDGISILSRDVRFLRCQITMDQILRNLILEINPKNILLVGKYAAGLYYPNNLTFEEMNPMILNFSGKELNLIPIQHPSRATYWESAAERLRQCFQN